MNILHIISKEIVCWLLEINKQHSVRVYRKQENSIKMQFSNDII